MLDEGGQQVPGCNTDGQLHSGDGKIQICDATRMGKSNPGCNTDGQLHSGGEKRMVAPQPVFPRGLGHLRGLGH